MQSSPNNVKILILGNSGIGKTAFLSRYFDKRFSDKHTPVRKQYANFFSSSNKNNLYVTIHFYVVRAKGKKRKLSK